MTGTWEDDWADWLRDWKMSQAHQNAASTIAVYERGIVQFRAWLEAEERTLGLGELTKRDVEAWLGHLRAEGRSESTRRVRLMSLRGFFGWILAEPQSPLSLNPAAGISAPAAAMPTIEVVPDEDLAAVLRTCGTKTFVDLRDAAIIRLLFSCGLRRAELVGLGVDDLDLNRGDLVVMGKGSKPRVVSVGGSKTPLALSRYMRARKRHTGASDAALFLSQRAAPAQGWRMTGGAIAEMLKRRCKAAGVPVFHPHQLRHTWAHQAKVAGLSDEDLERMAGWSSPMMVRRYGRAMADGRAREAHKNLALGDRL